MPSKKRKCRKYGSNFFLLNPNIRKSLEMIRKDVTKNVVAPTNVTICPDRRRAILLCDIQMLVLRTINSIVNGIEPKHTLPYRPKWSYCNFTDRLIQKPEGEYPQQEITLNRNLRRFNLIYAVLAKVFRLLVAESISTHRTVYYENTELFLSQKTVDSTVLDVCYLLNCRPWDLQLYTSSKGVVAGDVTITTADNDVLDCSIHGGVLVPDNVKGIVKIESAALFILIVEKDAAFQKLLDLDILDRLGPCILVTGKGEPDINTRLLVHRLFHDLKIPVFALVDGNPYGIEIMCTYRFGSLTLSKYAEHLAVPQIRWIGVHPTDIAKLSISSSAMSTRDQAKALELGGRVYVQKDQTLLEQVNCLIMSGRKCEIEDLSSISLTFLVDMYLPSKLKARDII